MPNHCTNILMLQKPSKKKLQERLQKFLVPGETQYEVNLDFNKIIRMPQGILLSSKHSSIENLTKKRTPEEQAAWDKKIEKLHQKNMEKYGCKDWYDWSVQNWGTKWNCYDGQMNEDGDTMSFYTAWSPPLPVIIALSKKIKQPLRLLYLDEGMMFVGEFLVTPDQEYQDNCYEDFKTAPKELLDEVGYDALDWEEDYEDAAK